MDEKRKKQIDNLWMDTDVGKWALALANEQTNEADEILKNIFKTNPSPYQYLMDEEKELCNKIVEELSSEEEGKEYIQELEKKTPKLVDVMVAHEFSMLDMFYI